MITNFVFYSLIILGGGATLGGVVWDLTRSHHNLKCAEQESRRMNHTEKIQ